MSDILEEIARAHCRSRNFAFCAAHCKDGCTASHAALSSNGSYVAAELCLPLIARIREETVEACAKVAARVSEGRDEELGDLICDAIRGGKE